MLTEDVETGFVERAEATGAKPDVKDTANFDKPQINLTVVALVYAAVEAYTSNGVYVAALNDRIGIITVPRRPIIHAHDMLPRIEAHPRHPFALHGVQKTSGPASGEVPGSFREGPGKVPGRCAPDWIGATLLSAERVASSEGARNDAGTDA